MLCAKRTKKKKRYIFQSKLWWKKTTKTSIVDSQMKFGVKSTGWAQLTPQAHFHFDVWIPGYGCNPPPMPQITAGDKQAGESNFAKNLRLPASTAAEKGLELKSKVKETCIRTLGFTGSRYGFWWNSGSKQVLDWGDGSVGKLLVSKHNDLHSHPSNVHKNTHIMSSASKPSTGAAGGWLELTVQGV